MLYGIQVAVCIFLPVIFVVLCVDNLPSLIVAVLYCTVLLWLVLFAASLVFGVIARWGLKSYVCCSVISLPARWNSWIYLHSQQCNKGDRMNCWEYKYIQEFERAGRLITEQQTYDFISLLAITQKTKEATYRTSHTSTVQQQPDKEDYQHKAQQV